MTDLPTVGDLMDSSEWPEFVIAIWRMRDNYGLSREQVELDAALGQYYCVRCHHRHFTWTAVGLRHAVRQPSVLPPVLR